jgi:PAS domain S-box-containing protein
MQIYRDLLEAMPDAIVVGDAAGRIVQANSQAERLFACSRSALIGEPIDHLLSEQGRSQYGEAVARILAHRRVQGTHATLELNALRRDGREFAARISLAPLETEMGTCIVCVARDVSERQRLQHSLHNSRRLKSEFFGHMSHELGTPLNSIIGFAEFLLEGKSGTLSEQQRECLEDILGSGRRLLRLISQIMELARVEAGTLELNAQTFPLRGLIEEACSAAALAAQNKRVAIHRNVAPGLNAVTLDRERLLQVLDYLLTNAIKFSSEGREIHLSVTAQGDAALCVRIWDSGTLRRHRPRSGAGEADRRGAERCLLHRERTRAGQCLYADTAVRDHEHVRGRGPLRAPLKAASQWPTYWSLTTVPRTENY